jgi:uncharacterized damage-inducible protein DinB
LNKKFQHLINAIERDNQRIFEMLKGLPTSHLNYSPTVHTWSINQILVHLLTAEHLSLTYMKKKSLGIETLENTGVRENFKSLLLTLSQRLPLKFKAPKGVEEQTPDVLPLPELIEKFEGQLTALKTFLETIEDKNVYKKIFKHPRVGMLNATQGINFFLEHRRHHTPQLNRLINRKSEP